MEVQSIDFVQANSILNKILKGLQEEEAAAAAWGPESDQGGTHAKGVGGSGGASNVANISDALDGYLVGIADALMTKYDISEDDAYDFLSFVADQAASMGMLPEYPEDDASDDDFADWYAKAGSIKFDAMCMNMAVRELGDDE